MLAIILILIALLALGIVIVISRQPVDFRITRSIAINVPASSIFPHLNDLRKWQDWSPWAKLDPACKVTFEGPPAGEGAAFAWAGNSKVGEGRMTVLEACPDAFVRYRVDFVKPFPGTNPAEIVLKPDGVRTEVVWAMEGRKNFVMKAAGLFLDCEKMLGPDLERGLSQLKTLVEGGAAQP